MTHDNHLIYAIEPIDTHTEHIVYGTLYHYSE